MERPRVLFLSFFPPAAGGRAGGTQETALLLLALARDCDVHVLCLRGKGEAASGPELVAAGVQVEEVDRGPTERNALQRTVRGFGIAWGWCIGRPRAVSHFWTRGFASRVSEVARSWPPDVVHVEHSLMGLYVDVVDRAVPRVLRVLDPQALAAHERVARRRGIARLAAQSDAFLWARFERRVIARMDAVVALTETDRGVLERFGTGTAIVTAGIAVAVPERQVDPSRADDRTVAYVGNFAHEPNVDAATSLATRIMPAVRAQVSDARLLLVGEGSDRLELDGGLVVATGSVLSVFEALEGAALVAVPLRMGGGMRVKVFEALALGKAVVASPRAADGFPIAAGSQFVAADTDTEFAAAIVTLLRDRQRRDTLGTAAREWAIAYARHDPVGQTFVELYRRLVKR